MKIFTVSNGEVKEYAKIQPFKLKGAGVEIPAIVIGEEGRNREIGILPVDLIDKKTETICLAKLSQTKLGKPKLIETTEDDDSNKIIVVLRTPFGFRGSNNHSGDVLDKEAPSFNPFPGEILVKGRKADGLAGNMAYGDQLIAVLPIKTVFSTGYSGRLYGKPGRHYYYHDGNKLLSATWAERETTDCF
jgi:hypothetical protein